jgi:hypothetical protein
LESTVSVSTTFTPVSGAAPTIGVVVRDKAATPAALRTDEQTLGTPYAVPTEHASVSNLDYDLSDAVCMANVSAAMSASFALPAGTTLTSSTRGLPGGPGTAYGITNASLSSRTVTFTMQPPTYIPTQQNEKHTAVTFRFTGPDGYVFDVPLQLGRDHFLKWPSLTVSTTSEPSEIAVRATRLVIRWPFTGDRRVVDAMGNTATFSGGFTRDDNETAIIVPQTIADQSCTLTLTIAPRGTAPTRPVPSSLRREYLSTTVPSSRIIERKIPTAVTSIGLHGQPLGGQTNDTMLRGDFETDKTTPDSSATARGIGIDTIRWVQGVTSQLHINESVSNKDPFIFTRGVPITIRVVILLSATFQKVLSYNMPEVADSDEANSHNFFTHESKFDSARASWTAAGSVCRAPIKYCTLATLPRGAGLSTRTLLVQNADTRQSERALRYELQDVYTMELPRRDDDINPANTHVRMITTYADSGNPRSGVFKLDLRSVTSYTPPFTIFGLRETNTNQGSRPSIKYIEESGQKKLSVQNSGTTEKLACTLPTNCRIVYTYSATSGGVIEVRNADGTPMDPPALKAHTLSNFGNTTDTPVFHTQVDTTNGVMIFHHCVARAELVVAPTDSDDFTAAQHSALLDWARATSST